MARTRLVSTWLFVSAALVVTMVGVGGVTRMTRSGLSIVEWNPVSGALPPLSRAAWQEAFDAYRASPEGRLVNSGLDLGGFQRIFLVEWFHRLLGRLIGFFFFLPWLVFTVRRQLTRAQSLRYLGWFALGGLQGALGWFMVKSGLVDVPRVSPYRLTAHLLLALLVYSGLLWEALRLWRPRDQVPLATAPTWPARAFVPLLVLAMSWGGFMAGFKAGWLSDTFPLMAGEWVPSRFWAGAGPLGVVTNAFLVHFTHRILGLSVAAMGVVVFATAWRARPVERRAASGVMLLALLQATLGVLTVWTHVPIALALAHQVNAAILLGASLALIYLQPSRRSEPSSEFDVQLRPREYGPRDC